MLLYGKDTISVDYHNNRSGMKVSKIISIDVFCDQLQKMEGGDRVGVYFMCHSGLQRYSIRTMV
jgi:hypothetical protein